MNNWINVASVDSFDNAPLQTFDYEGTSIAVIRLGEEFHALTNVCTHEYELMEAEDLEGEELVCARHGARFCVRTGEVISPPAVEDLETFPTQVESGVVKVCVDSLA